jgi:hypothetical protein
MLTHDEMMAMFTVSPANDPCVLHHFTRQFELSDIAAKPSLDNEVTLIGTFPNNIFKLDKTVPTNTQTVRLRAETRGLIRVDKTISYVVCPPTGGNTITKPIGYWDQTVTYRGQQMLRRIKAQNEQFTITQMGNRGAVDLSIIATGGTKINLLANEHYMMIDVGSTGTAANVPFSGWEIADVFDGCGTFEYYSVSSDESGVTSLL